MQSTSSIKQTLAAPANTKLVIALLEADPAPSRNGLAKDLCRRLELRDPKGDWQRATTSKALRKLADEGLWRRPKPCSQPAQGWHPTRLNHPVPSPRDVPELLQEVRGLSLIEVVEQEHLRIWNELMLGEHPLKDCRPAGSLSKDAHPASVHSKSADALAPPPRSSSVRAPLGATPERPGERAQDGSGAWDAILVPAGSMAWAVATNPHRLISAGLCWWWLFASPLWDRAVPDDGRDLWLTHCDWAPGQPPAARSPISCWRALPAFA